MCSDGLTDLVDKEEIRFALRSSNRNQAIQDLTQMANDRGGHDNITIVLLEIPGSDVITQVSQIRHNAPRRRWFVFASLMLTIGILLAVILATLGGFWLLTRPGASPTPISSPTTVDLLEFPSLTPFPLPEISTPFTPTPLPATETPKPTITYTATVNSLSDPSTSTPSSP